jgi:CHAT domain
MSRRDAIAELAALWDSLPELVGEDWPALAPRLIEAVDLLPAAASEYDYATRAAAILQLLRPYPRVWQRLAAALDAGEARGDTPALSLTGSWSWLAHRLVMAAGSTDRPGPRPTPAQWINAQFEDHDPARCLRPHRAYVLAFDVGTAARPLAANVAADLPYGPDEESAELSVQVVSPDAQVEPIEDTLTVPRDGASRSRARFRVTPLRSGDVLLNALFLRHGNVVQLMTLRSRACDGTDDSGGALEASTSGRLMASAAKLGDRDLSIVLVEQGRGYEIILTTPRPMFAVLPHRDGELDDIGAQARLQLQELVTLNDPEHGAVYRGAVDIPQEVHDEAVRLLNRAGYLMYQRLFFGPAADAQLQRIGVALQKVMAGPRRRIQIVSQRPLLPWQLMCPAPEPPGPGASLDHILGFRHEVDYLPLDPDAGAAVLDTTIDTMAGLTAVLAVNEDIDLAGTRARRLVAGQLDYWRRRCGPGLRIDIRRSGGEVVAALANPARAEQLLYFFCHASSSGPGQWGGPMNSELSFTGDSQVALGDLYVEASPRRPFPGNPLVILNACESAALSSSFYEGFLPYLIAKGARGVIGTEADTPAVFAAAWAERFFDRLLAGQQAGQALLAVRREFAERHRNVLGLLYALYCDGDTALRPGLD